MDHRTQLVPTEFRVRQGGRLQWACWRLQSGWTSRDKAGPVCLTEGGFGGGGGGMSQ